MRTCGISSVNSLTGLPDHLRVRDVADAGADRRPLREVVLGLALACRHHIAELVVREAWVKIFDTKTSSPKVQLFETLKKS